MPLQEFLADLQEDWPLQEFTPVHWTLASSALAVETAKVPNSTAAAVAIATPPALVVFIARSLGLTVIGLWRLGPRLAAKKSVPVISDRGCVPGIAAEHEAGASGYHPASACAILPPKYRSP
jgi:hypothetical protein